MSIENQELQIKNQSGEAIYIILLRNEFLKRKAKNAAYSLNAFSKHLEIDQSLFSKILSGKKKISQKVAADLLRKAGIAPDQISSVVGGFIPLDEDEFNFIADWVPFSILELAKTRGFKPDPKWIAKRLGVHQEEIHSSISRLERFGFIRTERESKAFKLCKPSNNWANTKQTSVARKQLQKKLANMSLQAIDAVPFELREHGSLTVAINKKRLPDLKEKLNRFRMELGEFLQADSELNEVFQITMSAFPLTQIGKK